MTLDPKFRHHLCIQMGLLWWFSSKENACNAGTAGDAGLIPGLGRFPGGSDSKEPACNAGDLGSIPGLGRSPGGGHGNPLLHSCLENPLDKRA